MYLAIVFVSFFVFDDFDTYFTLSPVLNLVSANREIIHHSVIKIRKKSLYQSFLNSSLMQSYLFPHSAIFAKCFEETRTVESGILSQWCVLCFIKKNSFLFYIYFVNFVFRVSFAEKKNRQTNMAWQIIQY